MSALQDASVFGAPQVDPSVYIAHGTTLVGDERYRTARPVILTFQENKK